MFLEVRHQHVPRVEVTGEALPPDHVQNRSGQLQDLLMLALQAGQTSHALRAVGMAEPLRGR